MCQKKKRLTTEIGLEKRLRRERISQQTNCKHPRRRKNEEKLESKSVGVRRKVKLF